MSQDQKLPQDVMLEITIRLMRDGSMDSRATKCDDVAQEASNTLALGCLQRTSSAILASFKTRTREGEKE